MAVVTLEEAKRYLRVDSGDEDGFISGLLETGESMCADMARMEAEELEGHLPMARITVLYVTAYLYEHREQADHEELVQTLRSLLFGIRREVWQMVSGPREMFAGMQSGENFGTICIPVYVGGTLLDEEVVDAQARQNLRSGGR